MTDSRVCGVNFRLQRWRPFALLLLFAISPMQANANAFDSAIEHTPAIPLLDEDGVSVLESGKAYSPKKSCEGSGCHDYDALTHAYHFEFGRDESSDDYGVLRGMPQLVSPGYFGGYSCMGGDRPSILSKKKNTSENDFMDYGAAGLVQDCTGCHVGGGFMEKDRNGIRYDQKPVADIQPLDGDYYNRGTDVDNPKKDSLSHDVIARWDWKKSGVVEGDCMICHADFSAFKKFPASNVSGVDEDGKSDAAMSFWQELRRTALVGEGFFREASTAMFEFYDVKQDGSEGQQLVSFEREVTKPGSSRGYKLTLDESGKPIMKWNRAAFDENGQAHIKMLRFPGNDNCMMCHRTSNSRRGFYGFGETAIPVDFDDDGIIDEAYKDDVHKGKEFIADNGEARKIENCNTCHSRNYFNKPSSNVELSVDHNFLKGNSDMDIRNDLDFGPNARACEHCHQEATTPVIPSGHLTLLDAHREIWKANGDMAGYSPENLTKITKTHFDVVSCQACHITGKSDSRGNPIETLFRYRQALDGKLKIFPYNSKARSYWKDKNSNRVLSRLEINTVYQLKKGEDGEALKDPTDEDGKRLLAAIVDPISGDELVQVTASLGRHGTSFTKPDTFEGYAALKTAYDKLMQSKGVSNANMQEILGQANQYIMSHNVRSSDSSVPCLDCHNRKQSGAFSALVSTNGLLGEANVKEVRQLVDKRLVDEGIVVLALDYFKVDDAGLVTENVSDILFSTKVNPFMTMAKASNAMVTGGEFKRGKLHDAMGKIHIPNGEFRTAADDAYGDSDVLYYNVYQGDAQLKAGGIIAFPNATSDVLLPTYRIESRVFKNIGADVVQILENTVAGKIASDIFLFNAVDKNKLKVAGFPQDVVFKLPYRGGSSTADGIRVAYLEEGGGLNTVASSNIIKVEPQVDGEDGYVLFTADKATFYAVLNATN